MNEREKSLYSLGCSSLSLGVPTREVSWSTIHPLSGGGKWPEDHCMPFPRIRISTHLSLCFLFNFKFQKAISHCPHLWELSSEYWTYWKTIKSRGLSGVQLNCRGDTAQILQRNSKVRKPRRPAFHCLRYFLSKALQWFFFPSDLELKTLFLIFLFKSLKFLYSKYLKIKYKPLSLPLL